MKESILCVLLFVSFGTELMRFKYDWFKGRMNQPTIITLLLGALLEPGHWTQAQYAPNIYRHWGYGNNLYGSKTGYFWSYHIKDPTPMNTLMNIQFEGRTCTAMHVNFIARHGARYTSAAEMQAFTDLQNKLKSGVLDQQYSFINTWKNRYPLDQAERMTTMGKTEMEYLANRIGLQLRKLLAKALAGPSAGNDSIKFGATRLVRTQTSARVFQNGLFRGALDRPVRNDTSFPITVRDKVLRLYDNCNNYEKVVANKQELTKFQNGQEMRKVREEISSKLKLNSTLTVADVKLLWMLCATELYIMDEGDWCRLMTDEHREVLEYENDLTDFYDRLYGYPVTAQMACPLVHDVFSEMDSAIAGFDSGKDYTHGVFQFGHADTVIDFAANLGFFNDNIRFKADNYQILKNRTFNSARVDPFSTNFAFILYNCGGAGPQNYALRLLFNEDPLPFPACNGDICRYDKVRQSYNQSIDNCNWSAVCGVDQSGVPVGK